MISYIENEDNVINLFLDINTVCNLNCSYCFARKEKSWNRSQSLKNIKFIFSAIKFSKYKFNLLLFGGEALMHPDIEEIVNMANLHLKILDVVILSNGVYKGNYELDAKYVFSLHDLTDSEYDSFKEHCKIVQDLTINMVIKEDDKFKKRYLELQDYKIEHSQIYDNNVQVQRDLSSLDFLVFQKHEAYLYNNKSLNYNEYFKIHKSLVPREIGLCQVKELNIDIDGNIANDCNHTDVNIFTNPLFFKIYDMYYDCQLDKCADCTGTIRTTKYKD